MLITGNSPIDQNITYFLKNLNVGELYFGNFIFLLYLLPEILDHI
jgi:hypothetical protein